MGAPNVFEDAIAEAFLADRPAGGGLAFGRSFWRIHILEVGDSVGLGARIN